MILRKGSSLVLFAILLIALSSGLAAAATIRSWDSANQRGGDLFGAGLGSIEYGHLSNALTGRGHVILPGVSTLTAADLANVDVFFHGTSSRVVTPAEGAVLSDFVAHGGCLIVESNSVPEEQQAADAILVAVGIGPCHTGTVGGVNDAAGGTFDNVVTRTTVGPLGDLRGQTFGTSVSSELTPGTGTVVGRVPGPLVAIVEFSAAVLATGDPYGLNLFQNPTESLYNPNNEKAYLNFIETCGLPTPVRSRTWGDLKAIYR
jgi:hypothetical protein